MLEQMSPITFGGDMISEVSTSGASWAHIPERFEAGTPNIAGAIGFGAACRYLEGVGMEDIARHENELYRYTAHRMDRLPYIRPFGDVPLEQRGGIYSFEMIDVHPHDVGSLLDQQGIAVRTGFHCAQPLMRHFGVTGTVRASFYLYNTTAEIDRFVAAVERVYGILS